MKSGEYKLLNLILHITLPIGLALTNGQALQQPVTFDIMSAANPFYASVAQVRLRSGPLLRRAQDITIAQEIYNISQQADLLNMHHPTGGDCGRVFYGARNQWVQAKAAKSLMTAISVLQGGPQNHTLANFTFDRGKGFESEGLPKLLKDLDKEIQDYEISIRSGGTIAPGGHVRSRFAAKGIMDWEEKTPSRNWIVTGMGANAQSPDSGGLTGGRGKPVKFYASPLFMGPMSGYRFGVFQSSSPLSTSFPTFATFPISQSFF
jgi:hypothetical protein